MPLNAGSRVGPYEIIALIGAGGMGEVYRARDTRLDRDVAIKILPDALAGDADRLMRFEREAKTLATLNHPHIAQIHGFEHSGTTRALVMELVEGEDLSQQIARGPIAIDDALSIARQIADALEAAHDRGIVHRDLKPANIKVSADGNVKVLDFGLAKALEGDSGDASAAHMNSPTITSPAMTRAGVIMGTAAYMSPEQARGRVVDKRADIWAFGVVLYEMLTTKRAFDGETVSDTLAVLLTRDVDLNVLPPDTPAAARRLLARCLARDPRMRLRDIGEARIALDAITADGGEVITLAPSRGSRTRDWFLGGVVGAVVAALAALAILTPGRGAAPEPSRPVLHLSIPLPADSPILNSSQGILALSRDGSQIAYVSTTGAARRILLRNLSSNEFRVLPGTDGATSPFFSPDGAWLAFSVPGRMKRVPVGGGSPITIADVSGLAYGGQWNDDDTIVFTPNFSFGIFTVPAAGGTPRELIAPDRARQESGFNWPQVLPTGDDLLFTVGLNSIGSYDDAQVVVEVPGRPDTRRTLAGGTAGRYLSTGHLMFAHGGRIVAAPFDLTKRSLTGPAVPVLDGVVVNVLTGLLNAAVSDTGMLAYLPGPVGGVGPDRLVTIDRRGAVEPLGASHPFFLDGMSLSPDGRRLAVRAAKANDDIHVFDINGGTFSRFTLDGGDEQNPLWTPDGKRLIYSSNQAGNFNLYWRPIDGSSGPERLVASPNELRASTVSPDGKVIVYTELNAETGLDIMATALSGDRTPRPVLKTPFQERMASFSPKGDWLAYESDESGRAQIYVMRFAGGLDKQQISVDGGKQPLWSADGRELYFLADNWLMAASVESGVAVARPQRLFEFVSFGGLSQAGASYALLPGGRFVSVSHGNAEPIREIRVIINWFEDLKRRVPIK